MSYYDSLRFQFGMVPAEDRLRILRVESLRCVGMLHGEAAILQQTLAQSSELVATQDLMPSCHAILAQAICLRDVLDALVLPQQRHDRGMAELRPYDSLLAAITETARVEGVPLATALADPTHITISMQYPLCLEVTSRARRQCYLSLDAMQYQLDIAEWKDTKSVPTPQFLHQWVCPTLADVTRRINDWLIEQWSVDAIVQVYG